MSHQQFQQPFEVRSTQPLHADLLIAAYEALESAVEQTERPAHEGLEPGYPAALGQATNWCYRNGVSRRLGATASWHTVRNFVALIPPQRATAIRLGRCDAQGRPNDRRERKEGAPFKKFINGEPLLFENCELRSMFASYSIRRVTRDGVVQFEVDRVVLSKFEKGIHVWSWGLDPADPGRVRSVLDGKPADLEIIPTFIPIERQRRYA